MKKILALLVTSIVMASSVCAETPTFTPLNFNDSSAIKTTATTAAATTDSKGNVVLSPAQVVGGNKMQSAITQIDNAQVDVRNQLLDYRTKYTDLDNQYQSVKAARKAAKKHIKNAEKRIKNLDKAKSKIQKNFEQKNNI